MPTCNRNCVSCVFKEHSLLKNLKNEELAILDSRRKSVEYKKGEIIYKEGLFANELLCLNSGKVKITKRVDNDKEQIIDLKKPVDFLGFQALMSGYRHQNTATTIEDSGVCSIHKEDLLQVIANNSSFALKIIEHQAKMLTFTNQRLVSLTSKNMKARLCDTLLILKDVFGIEQDNTLKIALKRREIAELSNMTTANVIRTLAEIAKENIVELAPKKIRLLDLNRLKEVALSD